MTEGRPEIVYQTVPPVPIATLRFIGARNTIPDRLSALRAQVAECVTGPGFCLTHGGNSDAGYDLEVAYPVSCRVDMGVASTRNYSGGEFIGIIHRGPYESMPGSWRKLYGYVAESDIGLAHGPSREVYLEGEREHGSDSCAYVSELQEPLLMPLWMDRLARGLDAHAGRDVRERVMAGSESLSPASPPRAKSDWAKGAMDRMDALVAELEARHCIMAGCAHVFPQERIDQLRKRYHELGDVDALLSEMGGDRSNSGRSYYAAPRREGSIVHTTKVPWDPSGFEASTNSAIRRSRYCHCALVRDAIRSGETISGTYCHCGTGWFSRLWEGILGHPVRVDVERSVLQGDDDCTFAIHLKKPQ